jgi:hypothetical protein
VLADAIVQHEALWKLVALGNLISQMAPFAACFFVKRPRVRLLLGAFFVIETVALDLVMGLPNYQWLPLAVAFVDWDHFLPRLRQTLVLMSSRDGMRRPAPAHSSENADKTSRLASGAIAVFVSIQVVITFGPPGLDLRLRSYPISQYRMFSVVRAKRPYGRHQSWEFDTLRFSIEGRSEQSAALEDDLDRRFRKYFAARRASDVERIVREAARRARRAKPSAVVLRFAILQAPAYPAAPELAEHSIGILARLRGKSLESLLGTAGVDERGPFVEPQPVGLTIPADMSITYILDQDPRQRPLEITRHDARLYYRPEERGRYTFVAHLGAETFVIAEATH